MSYNKIYKHYEECLEKFGDTNKGVDWPIYEDTIKRYNVMLSNIEDGATILDFGCGCGHLYEYILKNKINIKYFGLDISKKFYDVCINKFNKNIFYNIDILINDIQFNELPNFDYIILNGVFTEKRELTDNEMYNFMTNILIKLFEKTNKRICFNVMCPIVDWKDENLFYLSFDKLGLFLKEKLSRYYEIKNNYGLWEYTCFIYKEPITFSISDLPTGLAGTPK